MSRVLQPCIQAWISFLSHLLTFLFNIRLLKTENPLIKPKPDIKILIVLSDKFSRIVRALNQMTLITPTEVATFSAVSLVHLKTTVVASLIQILWSDLTSFCGITEVRKRFRLDPGVSKEVNILINVRLTACEYISLRLYHHDLKSQFCAIRSLMKKGTYNSFTESFRSALHLLGPITSSSAWRQLLLSSKFF